MLFNWIGRLRGWLLDRLGIDSHEAREGRWWELDFIIVILIGAALFGIAAWLEI